MKEHREDNIDGPNVVGIVDEIADLLIFSRPGRVDDDMESACLTTQP